MLQDMAQFSKRLMAICSVAVTTVYAAGYIYTMPSAQASTTGIPNLSSGSPIQSTPGAAASTYNFAEAMYYALQKAKA